jgi:hypothetical protein
MTNTHPDFLLYAGSTWQIDATLHDTAGNPLDLTSAQVVWRLYSANGSKVLELTDGNGIEIVNATGGLCRITVPAAQTATLAPGSYRDDIVVTGSDGFVCTQAVGVIIVNKAGGIPVAAGDINDPCAVLAQLNGARLALLTGTRMTSVNIENYSVQFSAASMDQLDGAIRQYETLCNKQSGKASRRYAIGSTMRPRSY